MQTVRLEIPDVQLLTPRRHADARGFFSEIFNISAMREAGIRFDLVQENLSFSQHCHTVRGLHFQTPPYAQAKLVQVIAGSILDVAVDLRVGSPWFGHHVAVRLDAIEGTQILVPAGFAHGFCTLEADTLVLYRVDARYAPAHDSGLRWDDPDLAIAWPARADQVVLSDKDRRLPAWTGFSSPFVYTSGPATEHR